MFERYTQSARRVIFHAREEAMRHGSPYIESEHLLLGVLRENDTLPTLLCGATQAVSEFRRKPLFPYSGWIRIPSAPLS